MAHAIPSLLLNIIRQHTSKEIGLVSYDYIKPWDRAVPRVPWRYFAVPCLPVIPCGVIYCESLREARFCVILCLNVIDILLRVFTVFIRICS